MPILHTGNKAGVFLMFVYLSSNFNSRDLASWGFIVYDIYSTTLLNFISIALGN